MLAANFRIVTIWLERRITSQSRMTVRSKKEGLDFKAESR
jgi:hypothetical protein